YEYLKRFYKDIIEVHGPHIATKGSKISNTKTVLENLNNLPKKSYDSLRSLIELVRKEKPNIIISDFEPFTNLISKLYRIPLISIDNIHTISNCKLELPMKYKKAHVTAHMVTKTFINRAKYYFITTYFYPEPKNKKTFLFPPILRKEVLEAQPVDGNHVLVYQTYYTNNSLISDLKKIKEKFIIYGYPKEKKEANIEFRKFTEKGFVEDLASCKAVIANGGFTLLSEAIHLGKPILSVPFKNYFEQTMNAIYLEKLGYGKFSETLDKEVIIDFLKHLPEYKEGLKKYNCADNLQLFEKLDLVITELEGRKSYSKLRRSMRAKTRKTRNYIKKHIKHAKIQP
ncbi:MAG: teichoic acid biosynthesis protein, partial [Nanoarchaeota archaeon]|nr:teichoic acid biosynthesis protein [Nanoarchaeota archaeon]